MPTDGPAFSRDAEARAARRSLTRIAEALRCAVSDLYADPAHCPAEKADELLRLWTAIAEEAGGMRVLDHVRRIVGDQEPGPRP